MSIKAWIDLSEWSRAAVLNTMRRHAGLEHVSSDTAHRHHMESILKAAAALEDMPALQDAQAERDRIKRELAIEAADRCYQRAISRAAQAKLDADARQHLLQKALEARDAGDDIMKAAGLHPKDHPRDAQMRGRIPGFVFDLIKYPEFNK